MLNWLRSRRKLLDKIRRLETLVRLDADEIACLTRQRDAALDTIDRLRTAAQAETATSMALTESMRQR